MTDKLNVNTIEPEGATTTMNVGRTGKNVIITDNLKANTLKDAGGNTIFTSDGSGNLSSVNSGFGGAVVLLSTQTASSSASLSFTSGIDSTYKEYVFQFVNIHPATDATDFKFQVNAVGASGYDETMTTTFFRADHDEADTQAYLQYYTHGDQAQGTAYQLIGIGCDNDNDLSSHGELHLFNPASTTQVKNFYATMVIGFGGWARELFIAGYINTALAIDDIQFKMTSGNIDAGKIKMYGVK